MRGIRAEKTCAKRETATNFFLTCLSGLSPLCDNASRYFNTNPREVRIIHTSLYLKYNPFVTGGKETKEKI